MPRSIRPTYLAWTVLLLVFSPSLVLFWYLSTDTMSGVAGDEPPSISGANLQDGLHSLHGLWRFRPGDEAAWRAPGFDDSRWQTVPVPHRWTGDGYPAQGQMAWYRLTLVLPPEVAERHRAGDQLAVSMGKVMSAYELYAGGQRVGGVGTVGTMADTQYDRQRFYLIPASAVAEDNSLSLAMRVWGGSDAAVEAWGGGPYAGTLLLGEYRALILRGMVSGLPGLLFCVLTVAFGAHHLMIYLRNRGLSAYLWFALVAIDIAVYGFMLTQWKFLLPLSFVVLKKLEFFTIYLFPALALQMLWSLIDRPFSALLRLYQALFVLAALLVALVPGHTVHIYTLPAWQALVLPIFIFVPWVLVQKMRAGNREARIILPAVGLYLVTCLNDLWIDVANYDGIRLMPLGFIAMLIGMSISLVSRFTRMYSELEQEVAQRTTELRDANSRLAEAARVDPLTGVLNRRGFTEEAEAEIARMARSGEGFSIVLSDVDHFKGFNDEYGHVCGDHVLKRVAKVLAQRTRDIDEIGRWGGEEFILLLPRTDAEGAAVLAEKLRDRVATTVYKFRGERMKLTMTFGVSAFRHGDTLDSCIARADTALYHGKKNGRDRVMIGKRSGLSVVN